MADKPVTLPGANGSFHIYSAANHFHLPPALSLALVCSDRDALGLLPALQFERFLPSDGPFFQESPLLKIPLLGRFDDLSVFY